MHHTLYVKKNLYLIINIVKVSILKYPNSCTKKYTGKKRKKSHDFSLKVSFPVTEIQKYKTLFLFILQLLTIPRNSACIILLKSILLLSFECHTILRVNKQKQDKMAQF